MSYAGLLEALKGGAGSGNFGHQGRPGMRGGSASGGVRAVSPFDVDPDSHVAVTVYQGTTYDGAKAWENYDLQGLAGPVEDVFNIEESNKYANWKQEQLDYGYDPMIVWVSDSKDYASRYGSHVVKIKVPRNQLIHAYGNEFMMPTDADYEL